jgi:hypothetical protein
MKNINKWKLFLEDERHPVKTQDKSIVVCRSSQHAINECVLRGCLPDEIMFDHDLGGQDTSINFIRWMIDALLGDFGNSYFLPEDFSYSVHSQNPVGAKNIKSLMDGIILEFKQ